MRRNDDHTVVSTLVQRCDGVNPEDTAMDRSGKDFTAPTCGGECAVWIVFTLDFCLSWKFPPPYRSQ
ncbi:MAG: hypothetical protein FJW36_04570 [Acidobacteria bacterium]|nr:hypothetical protein [Acidobacteriota bacterium]